MKVIGVLLILGLLPVQTIATADGHFYRTEAERAIGEAAAKEGVDPVLLAGLCWNESRHHPEKINKVDGGSGSYGLCQVKVAMARAMGFKGSRERLLDPYANALIAARILNYHKARTGSVEEQIAAYNAGRVRFKDGVLRNIGYVHRVMNYAKGFRHMETSICPSPMLASN